jgi:hypothetical protein
MSIPICKLLVSFLKLTSDCQPNEAIGPIDNANDHERIDPKDD